MVKREKKNKLTEIQALRAIAFIFVIAQHGLGSLILEARDTNVEIYIEGVLMAFAEVAVPIFLFISGLTLTYTYKDKLDLKKYYKNRVLYLIIPYFVWSFINMIIYNPDRLKNFFMETIGGNGQFHLWYMGMILQMILIFPIIIYIGRFICRRNLFIKVSSFILIFIGYYKIAENQWRIEDFILNLFFNSPGELEGRIVGVSILFWCYFLFLGVFAGFNYEAFKKNVIKYRYIVYVGIGVLFIYKFQVRYDVIEYNRFYCQLYRTFNILFFYLLSIKLIEYIKIRETLSFIGKYSYVGYMIHPMVLYAVMGAISVTGIDGILFNGVVGCLITAILAPFIVYKISLIKGTWYITGIKDRK